GTTQLRRQMLLPFTVDVNIMSYETCRRLGVAIQPYYGEALAAVSGSADLKPLGTAEVEWSFCGQNKPYRSVFYVVRELEADFILGNPTIKQLELPGTDPAIAKRLLALEQQ
ncbi:uncharacterized protein BO97DRAFT_355297, partial [Aspergillus homomorphus CBS 101889]